MRTRYLYLGVAIAAALRLPTMAQAQSAPTNKSATTKAASVAPAPKRDISGIWGPEDIMQGIAPRGVASHAPFTEFGANLANNQYKPGDGPRKAPITQVNDPLDSCDPAGFPRNLLFELRPFQLVQTPGRMLVAYQYQQIWRTIWTDGRVLPKDPDP